MLAYTNHTTLFNLNLLICLLICTLNRVSARFMKVILRFLKTFLRPSKKQLYLPTELHYVLFILHKKKSFYYTTLQKSDFLH